jgi:uncharacterized membrane protein YeiH
MMRAELLLASQGVHWGGFKWSGNFTTVDLVAAATNSLNGALLARRPDHYRQYTIIGILLMALLGGLGGGITRDLLIGQVPAAVTNPAYITVSLLFGAAGFLLAYSSGQLFREGFFQFMTAFSLPWYAIVGAQAGVTQGLPVFGALLLALVGPTAGRYYIDITSGKTPKQFIRSEWFIGSALLTGIVWILAYEAGLNTWWSALVAFAVGFFFRLLALFYGWEEPMPKEPKGVVVHKPHVLLGRKLDGKSHKELHDLGLTVDHGDATGKAPESPAATAT